MQPITAHSPSTSQCHVVQMLESTSTNKINLMILIVGNGHRQATYIITTTSFGTTSTSDSLLLAVRRLALLSPSLAAVSCS